MNFNSQICTTKEQSKRLFGLGLKIETADMAYEYKPKQLADTDIDKDWVIVAHSPCGTDIPAWSLDRLIDMLNNSDTPEDYKVYFYVGLNRYDEIIALIQSLIHIGGFNKEYLNG